MKNYDHLIVLLLFFVFVCNVFTGSAAIYRINNNPAIKADFANLQNAHDSVAAGDTLYIEASPTSYGDLTMDKKLVIYGNGYLNNSGKTEINVIVINKGSEGSYISNISLHQIRILCSKYILKRTRVYLPIQFI